MRAAICASVLAVLAMSASAEAPRQGRIDIDTVGCLAQDDTLRFVKLMAAGDNLAAARFYVNNTPACLLFRTGAIVEREEEDVLRLRMTCVRPRGEPECRWVPTDLLVEP